MAVAAGVWVQDRRRKGHVSWLGSPSPSTRYEGSHSIVGSYLVSGTFQGLSPALPVRGFSQGEVERHLKCVEPDGGLVFKVLLSKDREVRSVEVSAGLKGGRAHHLSPPGEVSAAAWGLPEKPTPPRRSSEISRCRQMPCEQFRTFLKTPITIVIMQSMGK